MRQLQIIPAITNRNSRGIVVYLHELNSQGMLTAEEEVCLSRRIKQGDPAAAERLVRCNLRFVVSVAKKYTQTGLPLEDLVSEGNLGLITAAQRFDESKGFKFITYAVWWIRQSILNYINENLRMIRVPANQLNQLMDIRKKAEALEKHLERVPTEEELGAMLKIPAQKVAEAYFYSGSTTSYDEPLGEDDDYAMVNRFGGGDETVMELMEKDAITAQVGYLMTCLSPRERQVITLSFGLNGHMCQRNDKIAADLGVTSERVRQIIIEALDKIKRRAKHPVF